MEKVVSDAKSTVGVNSGEVRKHWLDEWKRDSTSIVGSHKARRSKDKYMLQRTTNTN